jgi:hypothetical protein
LIYGFMALHKKIENQSIRTVPWYRPGQSEAIPIPILGPDLIDLRQVGLIAAEIVSEQGEVVSDVQPEPVGD